VLLRSPAFRAATTARRSAAWSIEELAFVHEWPPH
jgi:hypothetical protein